MQKEYAYLAGIIDGEGTITITKHAQHGRRAFQYKPKIQVSNTDLRLMRFLQARFGGSVLMQSPQSAKRKAAYIWRLMSFAAIEAVLIPVQPYLIIKKSQAVVMRRFLNLRRAACVKASVYNGYGSGEARCYASIRRMNRKG